MVNASSSIPQSLFNACTLGFTGPSISAVCQVWQPLNSKLVLGSGLLISFPFVCFSSPFLFLSRVERSTLLVLLVGPSFYTRLKSFGLGFEIREIWMRRNLRFRLMSDINTRLIGTICLSMKSVVHWLRVEFLCFSRFTGFVIIKYSTI